MRRTELKLVALALLTFWAASPAPAGDREFQGIVSRLAVACHKRPMRFMGFVSFLARLDEPEGVGGLKMAIFDDIGSAFPPDERQVDRMFESIAGADFEPFVRVRSHHDGEQTYVYARDAQKGWELLILSLDRTDAVVIKMRLRPEDMKDWIDEPVKRGRSARGVTSRPSG